MVKYYVEWRLAGGSVWYTAGRFDTKAEADDSAAERWAASGGTASRYRFRVREDTTNG